MYTLDRLDGVKSMPDKAILGVGWGLKAGQLSHNFYLLMQSRCHSVQNLSSPSSIFSFSLQVAQKFLSFLKTFLGKTRIMEVLYLHSSNVLKMGECESLAKDHLDWCMFWACFWHHLDMFWVLFGHYLGTFLAAACICQHCVVTVGLDSLSKDFLLFGSLLSLDLNFWWIWFR